MGWSDPLLGYGLGRPIKWVMGWVDPLNGLWAGATHYWVMGYGLGRPTKWVMGWSDPLLGYGLWVMGWVDPPGEVFFLRADEDPIACGVDCFRLNIETGQS